MRKRGSFRDCYFILLLSIFFIILGRTGYSDSLNMNYVGGFLCHRVVETHATTDTLYIATEELVIVVDITDENYPYQKGFIELDASVYSIDIVENMAYVGTYNGLRIFDITDISAPVDHGMYSTSEPVSNLEAQGSMVLMVERDEGFRLLDVSDPANPVLDFQLDSYNAEDVCIQDTAAYMLENGGLLIYDISNSQSPALLSDTTYHSSQQIDVDSDFGAIMAYSTVRVLDLSNLTGPVQTDTFSYQ